MSDSNCTTLNIENLDLGTMRAVEIAGHDIVVCRVKDGIFAVDNICSHAYARLSEGRLRGTRLICPLHGAGFDVRDGRALGAPASKPLTCHQVDVVEGLIEVTLAGSDAAGHDHAR